MPQFFGETPCTTTWMSSRAAPEDCASASVNASMIFGTDSSVTRFSQSLTSMIGMTAASFVPWLGVATPTVCVVPFHDHPGVLLQLRRVETLEQRLGETLDQQRFELRRQPALEKLDTDERHSGAQRSTCCAPPS